MIEDGHLLIVCQSDNWRSLRSDIEKYLYIRALSDDDFIDDPYYADCRQRDLNNEFMTAEHVDELLQSHDEDFDGLTSKNRQ